MTAGHRASRTMRYHRAFVLACSWLLGISAAAAVAPSRSASSCSRVTTSVSPSKVGVGLDIFSGLSLKRGPQSGLFTASATPSRTGRWNRVGGDLSEEQCRRLCGTHAA